jgi:peptidoglycan-N-acetylglucosamine deacetylase
MLEVILSLIHISLQISPIIEDIFIVPAPANAVSITFDDGPHPTHTDAILDILRGKWVKATFFVIGLHIPRDKRVILREVREWHTVGGHSYSHRVFSKMDLPTMAKEIILPHLKLFSLTWKYPEYFRFPYGIDDIRVREYYHGRVIGWDVDAYDWKAKDPAKLAKNIIAQTKTGSIILLHDIKEDTVKALPMIIDWVRAKGLEFAPLPSLIATMQKEKNMDIVYYSTTRTGALHDHTKAKISPQKTSEEVLAPITVTNLERW